MRLKSSEYSTPVLGLIFLRYADYKFTIIKKELEGKSTGCHTIGKADYQARGVLYLPDAARFSTLLNLPEGEVIGKAINDAIRAIEADNEELRGILPKTLVSFYPDREYPEHTDHEDMMEWEEDFDPEAFDIDEINLWLKSIKG